jgi:VWFA-related protein
MMKRRLLIGLCLLVPVLAGVRAQQPAPPAPPQSGQATQPQPPDQTPRAGTIVRNVNLVDVLYTVVNKRQKLVTDLNKEDFRVFDDGAEQAIASFSQPTDLPLRIGMVLDTSNSIRGRLQFEQDAAIEFLFSALRRNIDQAFLMTFDDGPQMIEPFTGDTNALRDVILKQRAGGGTSLYDAIYTASDILLAKSPLPPGPNPDIRRVLVVISDGEDNSSNRSRGQAIEMAQRAGVIVYSISSSTQWLDISDERDPEKRIQRKYDKTEGDHVLEQMAGETGGRAFFPYRVDDLGQAFLDIGDELRHQYALAYNPPGRTADGKFHTIRIQVNRKDVIVRARKGYFAVLTPLPPAASAPATP